MAQSARGEQAGALPPRAARGRKTCRGGAPAGQPGHYPAGPSASLDGMSERGSEVPARGRSLRTERLALVPFAPRHVPFLHGLWTDREVRRFLWDDREIGREEAAAVVEASRRCFAEHGFGMWLLRLLPRRVGVGFCGLRHFGEPPQEVEILYGLLPPYWGRGLAVEASRAVLGQGFACGLSRIYAGADPPNAASFQVMARLGMRRHGTRILNGLEAVYYALDAPDRSASIPLF